MLWNLPTRPSYQSLSVEVVYLYRPLSKRKFLTAKIVRVEKAKLIVVEKQVILADLTQW
jgi:hypothetical protein